MSSVRFISRTRKNSIPTKFWVEKHGERLLIVTAIQRQCQPVTSECRHPASTHQVHDHVVARAPRVRDGMISVRTSCRFWISSPLIRVGRSVCIPSRVYYYAVSGPSSIGARAASQLQGARVPVSQYSAGAVKVVWGENCFVRTPELASLADGR